MSKGSTPPANLIKLATGGVDVSVFLATGAADQNFVQHELSEAGLDFTQGRKRILDWGCGCGRIARHWQDEGDSVELFGCDIIEDSVHWCQRNIASGTFSTCGGRPPLAYPDAHFDLIYAVSVLTHLTFETQYLWMLEIWRLLKPQGIAVLTAHGPSMLPIILGDIANEGHLKFAGVTLIDEELFLCVGRKDGPNQTGNVETQGAFAKIFSPFKILKHHPRYGLMGIQDTYVLRKKSEGPLRSVPDLFEGKLRNSSFHGEVELTLNGQCDLAVLASATGLLNPATVQLSVRMPSSDGLKAIGKPRKLGQKVAWTSLQAAYTTVAVENIPKWKGRATVCIDVQSTKPLDGATLKLTNATLF